MATTAKKNNKTAVKAAKPAAKKSAATKKSVAKKPNADKDGLMSKIHALLEENEQTIHFVLEIAAISLEKSDISKKNKKIAKAALALISEVVSPD